MINPQRNLEKELIKVAKKNLKKIRKRRDERTIFNSKLRSVKEFEA